jgi:TRAP-type C4-dicarboxylate transport system permease small subunit
MKKTLKWLDIHFEERLLAFFLAMITFIILFQVFMRYILKAAQPWPEELSRYCFIYSTMLSIGYCIRSKAMLRVDILVKVLPKIVQKLIEILIMLMSLALYVYLFYHSFSVVKFAQKSVQLSPAMHLPMYILYISAAVGFGLATLRTIQDIVLTLKKWIDSHLLKMEGDVK